MLVAPSQTVPAPVMVGTGNGFYHNRVNGGIGCRTPVRVGIIYRHGIGSQHIPGNVMLLVPSPEVVVPPGVTAQV